MKNSIRYFFIAAIVLVAFSNIYYSSNPPIDYTGRTGTNCTSCHSGSANPPGGSVSMTGLTSYYPGKTYSITVTQTGGSRYGFEMTSVLTSNTNTGAGTFSGAAGVNVTSQGGRSYARHSSANTTGSFSFNWTAPGSNVGNIRFYLAGNSANFDQTPNGDKIYTTTQNVTGLNTISYTVNTTPASCFGGNDGSATVSGANGGTGAPYTYSWGSSSSTTNTASGYSAGTYSVTVADANGNQEIQSFTIGQPANIAVTANVVNTLCGDSTGQVSASANGGNPPYTYAWSTGDSTSTATGLKVGTYSVTVVDQNSCQRVSSQNVASSGSLMNIYTGTNPETCNNGWGTATVDSVKNNFGAVSYLWSNGSMTASATGLDSGNHMVTVTDTMGCMKTDTILVSNQNYTPQVFTSIVHDKCGSMIGSITVDSIGNASAPFSYNWNTGDSTQMIGSLVQGNYMLTVTDSLQCTAVVPDTVDDLDAPDVAASGTDLLCYEDASGTAEISVVSGNGPFTFSWSNSATDSAITGLAAGTYVVTVTDPGSCTAVDSVMLSQPDSIEIAINSTTGSSDCNGKVHFNLSGGTPGYQVYIDDSMVTSFDSITGICSGEHELRVEDMNMCAKSKAFTIDQLTAVQEIPAPSFSLSPNPAEGNVLLTPDFKLTPGFEISAYSSIGTSVPLQVEKVSDQKIRLVTEQLDRGLYFVVVASGEQKVVQKLVLK